jgi:hypothetical protein
MYELFENNIPTSLPVLIFFNLIALAIGVLILKFITGILLPSYSEQIVNVYIIFYISSFIVRTIN